jgi:hypothetical protein
MISYREKNYPLICAPMIVSSYCSMVLPCCFQILFYLTHPNSSLSIRHNDFRIEQPRLQFRTSLRKQEDPTAWEPALENGTLFHGVV